MSSDESPAPMKGRVCLVTGATSGIGRQTALQLAELGATVVLVARDPGRGATTRDEIGARTGSDRVDLLIADLTSQAQVRRLAGDFRSRYGRLHVLVNDAGAYVPDRRVTVDGLESTFALNHLAPYLLTNLLGDLLVAGAPARVVTVTSGAQVMGRIDFDDLQGERRYRPQRAYAQSKLANVIFTYELARRLEGTGVTATCVHPGAVRTRFGRDSTGLFRLAVLVSRPFSRSVARGADTVVWASSSPEAAGLSGQYLFDRSARRTNPQSYDSDVARRLWDVSGELTGVETDGWPAAPDLGGRETGTATN